MSDIIIHAYKHRKNEHIQEVEPFNDEGDFLYSAFQVPLTHVKVRDWKNKKQKLLRLHNNSKQNARKGDRLDVTTDYHYNGETGSCYSKDLFNILEEEIVVLENMLLCENSFNDFDFDEYCSDDDTNFYFEMNNSWFEGASGGSFHGPHTHGPTGYSCVLYVNFNNSKHRPTVFMNPFFTSFFGCNSEYIPDFVEEGSLLCFPSPIVHYTIPNVSDEERLICSWNMKVVTSGGNEVIA